MDSYDYLMGNLQAALRAQRPTMKARIRKSKIKDLYERYTLGKTNGKFVCFGSYKFIKTGKNN